MAWQSRGLLVSLRPGDLAIQPPPSPTRRRRARPLLLADSTASLLDRFTATAPRAAVDERGPAGVGDPRRGGPGVKLTSAFADGSAAQRPRRPRQMLLNWRRTAPGCVTSEVAQSSPKLCGEAPSRFYGSVERSRLRIGEARRVEVPWTCRCRSPPRALAERSAGAFAAAQPPRVDVTRRAGVRGCWATATPARTRAHGTAPGGEPETRALARVAEEGKLDLFADVQLGRPVRRRPPRAQFGAQFWRFGVAIFTGAASDGSPFLRRYVAMPFAGTVRRVRKTRRSATRCEAAGRGRRMMGEQHAEQARGAARRGRRRRWARSRRREGRPRRLHVLQTRRAARFLLEGRQAPSLSVRRALLAREPRMDMAAAAPRDGGGVGASPEAPVKGGFAGEGHWRCARTTRRRASTAYRRSTRRGRRSTRRWWRRGPTRCSCWSTRARCPARRRHLG